MWSGRSIERTCQHCGGPFMIEPARVKKGRGSFCSRECRLATQQQHNTEHRCEYASCGRVFVLAPNVIRNGRGRFCSRSCKDLSQRLTTPLSVRLWEQTAICPHGITCIFCCWPWQGTRFSTGYGRLNLHGHDYTTSRLIWEVWHEQRMSAERFAAHHCNYPPCNNYAHIYPATVKQNAADAVRAGVLQHGSTHWAHKLIEEDIPEIFALRAEGFTMSDIAYMKDVSEHCISLVLRRKTWRHVVIPA
jgi:hypothetical protein